jgi:zinc protease
MAENAAATTEEELTMSTSRLVHVPGAPALACLLALSGAAGTGCATAGSGLPDDPVLGNYEPTRWVGTPKSGLRIIVQEDHSSPLVSVVAAYGVGGTSDPKGIEGMAHLVEHLVFRSRPDGGPVYWDLLKRMGGSFNASTSWDFTTYYTTVHKDHLETLLRLEAWRLTNTVTGVTPAEFLTEREVVRNELRQRWETTAGNKMFDLLFESLFPAGHPLRKPIGGTHESLTASKLEHAQAFVKEHYRPDNCSIAIVGDFKTDDVKRIIETWPVEVLFGPGGPEGPPVPPRKRLGERDAPPLPPPVTTALQRHKGPIDAPVLMLAWSLPPGLRGKDAVTEFAASRLNLALTALDVREEDDIMNVGAGAEIVADSSIIYMFADLRPWADPAKARKRLEDILVNAWTNDFVKLDKLQTEAVRWNAATRLLQAASRPLDTAAELAWYMGASGKYNYFKDHFDELSSLSTSEVTDFAYKYLTRQRAVAVYFEPESQKLPSIASGRSGAGNPGTRSSAEAGSHDIGRGMAANASQLDAERLRKVLKAPEISKTASFKLTNGLEIYVIPRPETPLAEIDLSLRGGNASTQPVGAGMYADALSRPMCSEYKGLASVGGQLFSGLGLTSASTYVSVPPGNLVNGMAALRDSVSCVEVSDEQFLHLSRWLTQAGRVYERRAVWPEYVAAKWFNQQLYPGHPFGEAGFVNPATLKDMRREDAQAFVSSLYRPNNGVAVVRGAVTVEQARAAAERYLSTWKGGAGGASLSPPAAPAGPTERRIHLVNRPQATQATVTIGCRLQPITPERLPAYDVLESLATESAWGLREQWGATYGVHGLVAKFVDNSSHFVLEGAIENAQVGKSIARLLDVVKALGTGTIAEPLFLTKRWDVGREFVSSYATADAQAMAILSAKSRGWPLDVWDKYPENLANTTRETLRDIMVPCVGKEVVAIVGSATVLAPQLAAEGLKLEGN